MKKPFVLTPSEEDLMNIFWVENRPLTSVELTELSKDHGWNQEYILNMLRSIKKKGMVEVCGTVQYNKQYARSFCYCVSRAAYAQSWRPPSESTSCYGQNHQWAGESIPRTERPHSPQRRGRTRGSARPHQQRCLTERKERRSFCYGIKRSGRQYSLSGPRRGRLC